MKNYYHIYYLIKRFIPRQMQLSLRRKLLFRKIGKYVNEWPINYRASSLPEGWTGWPDGKQFAFVLTHDVDTQRGHDRCIQLAEIEEKLGFRSSFNFVVDDYTVSSEVRRELVSRGFEVGVHGLTHNASLYRSRSEFQKQAERINQILKEWNAIGFRSPCMYRNLEWLSILDIAYDASTFDTDPFEPQPDGVETIFPFLVQFANGQKGYIELPYTLPQDFTLFVLMQEPDIGIWVKKLDWIAGHGGMALMNVHPDYLNFSGHKNLEEYPVSYYQDFLEHMLQKYQNKYWHVLPKEMAYFWKTKTC
ncbi:MAG: polysaccharide deacetylase family protein [Deltaproteobacteria bacterium]|nr:polysaccharide deacetylase family protein [Deltaproteobacteria bacterium]